MDYKEKYEHGLECIQEILSGAGDSIKTSILRKRLQPFFPELKEKENEDERIRKEIIDFVKSRGGFKGDWIAWLEKQGEQDMIPLDKVIKFLDEQLVDDKDEVTGEPFINFQNHGAFKETFISFFKSKMLEEQSEKKGYTFKSIPRLLEMVSPTDRAKSYCEKLRDSLQSEGYHTDAKIVGEHLKRMNGEDIAVVTADENADKPEAKFKVRDWIANGGANPCYVKSIFGDYYELCSCEGFEYTKHIIDVNYIYRLWTIADAKDGDVLVSGDVIFIFNNIHGVWVSCHCSLRKDCSFKYRNYYDLIDSKEVYPATKEQRDTLFAKMKEAGYEWDADKKELKKAEQKPDDNVEPKFKPGDWIIFNGVILHIDEVVNGYYRTTSIGDGLHNSYDWNIDNAARLWTIQDAKDGDVLVDEDNNIGLYLEEKDDLYWHSCIYIGCDNCLRGFGGYHNYEHTKPATKEQRDMLFQKMKEAGYEWDGEKKELKKIEQNPAESTKDYNDIDPHFGILVEDLMSTDKVEPKFKVRDWCIDKQDGTIFRIEKVMENTYGYKTDKGNVYSCTHDSLEFDSKLWTINDAKDGDVLTNGKIIVIFKQIVEPKYKQHIEAYIGLDLGCDIQVTSESWSLGIDKAMPATKEQRELLFQKMKEAGYEWDGEKKELKKIEPKTLDADDILPYLGNNQVQDILEDMGMLDDNGQCSHTAEEIFKAGMEHAFGLNHKTASGVKIDADKVIEWLKPLHHGHIIDGIINKFKEDFGL